MLGDNDDDNDNDNDNDDDDDDKGHCRKSTSCSNLLATWLTHYSYVIL